MFDIDSRSILVEVDPDAYFFGTVLDGMATWCPIVHEDKIIKMLYQQMKVRVDELIPEMDEGIEKLLLCGFSPQI